MAHVAAIVEEPVAVDANELCPPLSVKSALLIIG